MKRVAAALLLSCLILVANWGSAQRSSKDSIPKQANDAVIQSAPENTSRSTAPETGSLALNGDEVEQSVWRNAPTYLDLTIPELVKQIKELRGLVPEDNPNQIGLLLDRIGRSCADLLQHTPNLSSREKQTTTQWNFGQRHEGELRPALARAKYQEQEFEYLLLAHETELGRTLEEYRADKHGRPIQDPASRSGQMTRGFVSEWLQMLPANQSQAKFRYLRRQEVSHRNLFVIAFAQIPGEWELPPPSY